MRTDKAFIIASGDESAMNSLTPCALHDVCGRPAVRWAFNAVSGLSEECTVCCGDTAAFEAAQPGCNLRKLDCPIDSKGYVLLTRADMPLLSRDTLEALTEAAKGRAGAYLHLQEDEESSDIYDVCCLRADIIKGHTAGEDIAAIVKALEGREDIVSCTVARFERTRITDRASLWEAGFMTQAFINARHMKNGVTLIDPTHTYISADTVIGRDTILYPNTMLMGRCAIGEGCKLFDCRLTDTAVGDNCELKNVVSERSIVGNGIKIGPFVNLRPDTVIGDGCKIGDFVEVKNSNIGKGTKLPHLSYIGDADVGERVNVGCGSVFVNYDGIEKHRTTVGNDVFIGCQSNLVAPVSVGDGAYTAAGSTITEDVPEDSLAIARARQENKVGWVRKYYALRGKKQRS